jgi:heat shock protein HslJ
VGNIVRAIGLCIVLLVVGACVPGSQQGSGGDLTGKLWALSKLNGNRLVPGTGISAAFTSAGQVGGSAGCNRYSSNYTVSGANITFSGPAASTMMMCAQPVMDQETAYLKALADAKTYAVTGDELALSGADKTTLAVYKAQSQELAGTSWQVITYNNGSGAVTSVLAGTTLTASFGESAVLQGNAGCNDYNGSYQVNGDQISIGPLASTQKACADPAGVMDQETQFLTALQSAATYQIEGDVLEMRTKDGALAAQFGRK